MISVLSINDSTPDDEALREQQQVGGIMAGLDELSIGLMECIMSHPELRQLLCKIESMLYDGASKASSLVDGWSDKGSNVDLLSSVELLGRSAMADMLLTETHHRLLCDLSQLR